VRTLRGRLTAVGLLAVVGVLLFGFGLVSDRVAPFALGAAAVAVVVVALGPLVPRRFGDIKRVVGLVVAMLQRDEHGEPVAPAALLRADSYERGSLLVQVRYAVTTASVKARSDWLKSALAVGPNEWVEFSADDAQVFTFFIWGPNA